MKFTVVFSVFYNLIFTSKFHITVDLIITQNEANFFAISLNEKQGPPHRANKTM